MEIFIDSVHNKIVKEINSLKTKKYREQKGLFILEGDRLISEIPSKECISYVVISEKYEGKRDFCDKVYVMSDSLFAKISDTVNPQGILAVCTVNNDKFQLIEKENPFYVLLENVMDPGNMGTIIRTADAAGVDAVLLTKGCVDIYNPKVIRATMGSVFHLPIYRNLDGKEVVSLLNSNGVITIAAHLKGKDTPYNINMRKGCCVIIGNEANGLSDILSNISSHIVKIPMPGKAESMNAGIAAGILIYESVRQRLVEDR